MRVLSLVLLLWGVAGRSLVADAAEGPLAPPAGGGTIARQGDEIVVCGQRIHTTAPVVVWNDPGGYDGYSLQPRFGLKPPANRTPAKAVRRPTGLRYGERRPRTLSRDDLERVREQGWTLPLLRKAVDQFVIHFDARGTSQRCFEVLHDIRGLSVHFMLDVDGTIYQTLDLKEQAWHATVANSRSIGIEIANIGAYPASDAPLLHKWYARDAEAKRTTLLLEPRDRGYLRHPEGVLAPAREEAVMGTIQGQELRQYDFTDQQYDSLIRLTATLCTLFPAIRCDYPKDAAGRLWPAKLADTDYAAYSGILGHYHVQANKVDPGPAFQWERLIEGARARMADRR